MELLFGAFTTIFVLSFCAMGIFLGGSWFKEAVIAEKARIQNSYTSPGKGKAILMIAASVVGIVSMLIFLLCK